MMDERLLRGKVAVVGVAESDLGDVGPEIYPIDLAAQAALRALAEAGLKPSDVDGLFGIIPAMMPNLNIAEYLGIQPRISGGANIGGSSLVSFLLHAAMAIATGQCETALIVYGSTPRADRLRNTPSSWPEDTPSFQKPYRPRDPITGYALAAARHMHEFGTTSEQLAAVAVAAREWALLNPVAYCHNDGPLTVDAVLSSRMLSSPIRVRDTCLVTDGGGAVVLTAADRAADLVRQPIYVLGMGEAHLHRQISQAPDLTTTAAVHSSKRAYAMAGLRPKDVDVVELYDAFTINTVLFLEDLGFCKKGEGGAFVAAGNIAPGGSLPVNTNGGGLSYCHPGMYGIFTVIEAVRQLRGNCGQRQVPSPNVAIAHGNGGQLSSQVTAILGSRNTL